MSTFHPPDKWVALHKWLQAVDRVLQDWSKTKTEAERCLNS
jgi:hypothetical protein